MPSAARPSPKLQAASPSRVRHNPYARSPGSNVATPIDAAASPKPNFNGSVSNVNESFASTGTPPMMTPPTAGHAALHPVGAKCAADMWGSPLEAAPSFDADAVDGTSAGPYGGAHGGMGMEYEPALGSFSQPGSYYPEMMGQDGGNMPAAYDMDPNVAMMMYQSASAAANAAAQRSMMGYDGRPITIGGDRKGNRRGHQGPMGMQHHGSGGPDAVPCLEDLEAMAGTLAEQVRTASGSSFIQAAVKDSQDPRCIEFVWAELSSFLGDLLLDSHGCYVIKTLLDHLPREEVACVLNAISEDEQLGFSICTHSLHTRRVVQHIIENVNGEFLCRLMARHCADVAMTQQGCIVMQRSMDHAPEGPARDALFEAIAVNLVAFAKDPFANYVVQHLMEVGERVETAGSMWKAFRGKVVELACNKFASNVIEKCLFHCTAEVQHEILVEMYSVGPQMLYNMLQDSFGNYIIQSSIALATFRDVSFIDEQLRPVLAHTPYGHKIEARLDRRLKGKPVTARGNSGSSGPSAQQQPSTAQSHAPAHGASRRSGQRTRGADKAAAPAIPAGESSW